MSLNNLFTKSVKEKKFARFSHLDIFANKKFEASGFEKSVKEIKSSINFLGKHVKESKKLDDDMFTNYLSPKTHHSITTRIHDLFMDPTIINNIRVGEIDVINEKIKKCVGLYFSINEEDTIIFKSQLLDSLGNQTGVRVYAIADVNIDDEHPRAEYKIVLIDPFHLVIPSEHYDSKRGRLLKSQMEKETYNNNMHNKISMHEYFS